MRIVCLVATWIVCFVAGIAPAATVSVTDDDGRPMATAMVTRTAENTDVADRSDNGYPRPGLVHRASPQLTRFTDANGQVNFAAPSAGGIYRLRVRKQGYADAVVTADGHSARIDVALKRLADPEAIANSKPANLWLAEMQFDYSDNPARTREHFLRHCAFCHQPAGPHIRMARSREQWEDILDRMQMYGAMAGEDFLEDAPAGLVEAFADLNERHSELAPFDAWAPELANATITEWPIGDSYSQMHDLLVHPNGRIYVGDNLMDRIYAVDPQSGDFEVFKVPHDADARPGGILGERMASYPRTENFMGVHSFAVSPRDGHIFLTPSMRQELIEFDPDKGSFKRHLMEEGFYPHTVRVDEYDRVWFTLALSSQVAMFDRQRETFTYYDLPARSFREWLALKIIKLRLSMGWVGSRPGLDWQTTGFPMPYGIDVSPRDGSVWVARLYADDIARIDPVSGEITMIDTPFNAPRRLRFDADGDLWIAAFSEGRIARYEPGEGRFKVFDLPMIGETPYALNVDRGRGIVWVNGNQSDTLMSLHIDSETWRTFPLPRARSFTRDIEIAADGSIYTSNSHFPGWLIEDGQPTLIRVDPGVPADPMITRGAQLYAEQCDGCHSLEESKAPLLSTMRRMTFARVARALEFGKMAQQAASLDSEQRLAVARYLTADNRRVRDEWIAKLRCAGAGLSDITAGVEDNWGFGSGNRRALESGVQIGPGDVGNLMLDWVLAIPNATEMRSQPVAADGVLFLGTSNGNVLAIDQETGCIHWRFSADSSIRSSLNLELTHDGVATLFFADDLATVYAITADAGRLRWKRSLRWFPTSIISGSLAYHDGRLLVPVSSFETALAGRDDYPCCRSHGGLAAIDAADGAIVWEYHTTPDALNVGTTDAGTDIWGPSGASVWTTPAVDSKRGLVYIGTAQNMSPPSTYNSDAVMALDLETGAVDWVYQATPGDIWNVACHTGGANCPSNPGPDFDFGGGVASTTDRDGRDIVIAGQKSGVVHALDPDTKGAVIWRRRLSMGTSNGGIHWGISTSGDTVWAAVADPPRQREGYIPRPGIYALALGDGSLSWSLPVTRGCDLDAGNAPDVGLTAMMDNEPEDPWPSCSFYYGHSAAPVYANGLIYAGALDGKLRIVDAYSGELRKIIETNRAYETINGIAGHGGAIDLGGVLVDGRRLFVWSGYGMFGQMPGNVLLAFRLPQ